MESLSILGNLKRQHEDLVVLSRELIEELDAEKKLSYKSIVHTLSLFEGKLKIHLSMEDRHLYPQLLNHESEDVRSLTGEYIKEMSGIYDKFHSFILRWKGDDPPEDFPGSFTGEIKGIVEEIYARIRKEEDILFPLLEEAQPSSHEPE
jgi:iron-sulfur cluster repair protein YtfE (RIC family)